MDDDKKIIKVLRKTVKDLKFFWDYRNTKINSEEEGNNFIYQELLKEKPFMVARGGATEMRCIAEYLSSGNFSEKIRKEMQTLSGFFPADEKSLSHFCEYYINCISEADLICLWGVGAESAVVHKYCSKASFTKLHALEPYYFENPWSTALTEKMILVVHPFASSIQMQYEKRKEIWNEKNILPDLKGLVCLKAVQSIAGQRTEFASWFEALEYMKNSISKIDFDVAIIGAGAYGLPLTAYCKSIGKKAVQMSGATQILFGIKGKRWDEHPFISKFYNDAWVRALPSETPQHKQMIEGGSYW